MILTRTAEVAPDGFAIIEDVLTASETLELLSALDIAKNEQEEHARGGIRNLLDLSRQVAQFANSSSIRKLVAPVLGESAFAVRGTLFDKTPDANWKVPWHQDLSIAVRERFDIDGFGPWSVKAGVIHVQPPAAVLEGMLAVRIHLDHCEEENGPLRVIPGSHRLGRLTADQIQRISSVSPSVSCPVRTGGVLLMRPLLLHASSASQSPNHRRIIHLDFASAPLPAGLKWLSDSTTQT